VRRLGSAADLRSAVPLALSARTRDPELGRRLRVVVLWLLWSEAAAASGRNAARLPHIGRRTGGRRHHPARRARSSVPGRRPRG
jgi:hypothetical protein